MFFSSKKHSFFIIFFNFSNVQSFFIFCKKNLINRAEKTFLDNTIRYAFYNKLATFSDFERIQNFPLKNPSIFCKNPKIWTFWENLLFQSHSTAICYNLMKNIFRHVNNRCWLVYASSIGKHWSKKTHLFERKILLSIFSVWRKIKRQPHTYERSKHKS